METEKIDFFWVSDTSSIPDVISSYNQDGVRIWPYSLTELATSKPGLSPAVIFIDSEVEVNISVFPIKWLSKKFKTSSIVLYNKKGLKYPSLFVDMLHLADVSNVIDLDMAGDDVEIVIKSSIQDFVSKTQKLSKIKSLKEQNTELEGFQGGLEEIVKERTQHIMTSKREIEEKVSKMRSILRFVKELSEALSIDDVMDVLRKELKKFHRVKLPILAYAKSNIEKKIMYYQGIHVFKKDVMSYWPGSFRIRVNHSEDQKYLANVFGRPFAKLIRIPLILDQPISGSEMSRSACLFFEHSLEGDELEDFIDFVGERLQPLSVAVDRMLLEYYLNDAARIWANTFDFINDPVAIWDVNNQRLRSNSSFNTELLELVKQGDEYEEKKLTGALQESIETGEASFKKIKIGSLIYLVHTYPIKWEDDQVPTSFVNHYLNVTLSMELQSQMMQNEKMAAIGHLAGHIAHELNNPLTGIRSLSQILINESSNEQQKSDLQEVEGAAQRCQIIINNLQDFSDEKVESKVVNVSLNEIVEKTLPFLKTAMRNFESIIKLKATDDQISCQPQLLQQVVFNLVNNACQSMGDNGTIFISTEEKRGSVLLLVTDTGCGISKENQESIFDPFFTTKEQGKGTGLGLSMSRSIIEKFNGKIGVRSEVDKGSTFFIELPLVKS